MVTTDRRYSVGEAAQLSGITVRTLHHYGEIGLLVPGERTGAGYRHFIAGADLDEIAMNAQNVAADLDERHLRPDETLDRGVAARR